MPTPELSLVVTAERAGTRIDVLVGALEVVGSRAEAQRLIADGRVLVDGAPCAKRHRVSAGQTVSVRPREPAPEVRLEPEEVPHELVIEDEQFLVVDKPSGVVTHPSKGHERGTLVHGLLSRAIAGGEDPTRPGIVHRLDRDTSGLLVVARTPRAHRRLQRMLRDRMMDRRYVALVHGSLPPAVTIDRPVGRDPRNRTRMGVNVPGAREAVTHVRTLVGLERFTYAEVRLETGRTHQIRVHLESWGHPVVGDKVYGKREPSLGLRRQFLHAWYLAFPHPETGEPVVARSRLPDELGDALDRIDPDRLLPREPDR
jgi:23S rRNA pseudouridine1911/1915/1917 synthase